MVDYNTKYFKMSFRFNKMKPEEFGLSPEVNKNGIFVDNADNSEWIQKYLYDFGWGNEYGFMRLPPLKFVDLWNLLLYSNDQDTKYGAAFVLEHEYPEELLKKLMEELNDAVTNFSSSFKEAITILNLITARNRSEIIGKKCTEIEKDFENWKMISNRVKEILD